MKMIILVDKMPAHESSCLFGIRYGLQTGGEKIICNILKNDCPGVANCPFFGTFPQEWKCGNC